MNFITYILHCRFMLAVSLALSLPTLQSSTVDSLRVLIWSTVVRYFDQGAYAPAMAWLQRYTKRRENENDDQDQTNMERGCQAMAIVAHQVTTHRRRGDENDVISCSGEANQIPCIVNTFQLGDYSNALAFAEDALRIGAPGFGSGRSPLLSRALLVHALIGLKSFDRAAAELATLAKHTQHMPSEVQAELALIAEDIVHEPAASAVAIPCLDLLLNLDRHTSEAGHEAAPYAVNVQPFTEEDILYQLIRLCESSLSRLSSSVSASVGSTSLNQSNMEMIGHKLMAYCERLILLANQTQHTKTMTEQDIIASGKANRHKLGRELQPNHDVVS